MKNNSNEDFCFTCLRLGTCPTAKEKDIYREGCIRWAPMSKAAINANKKLVDILGSKFAAEILVKTPVKEKLKMAKEEFVMWDDEKIENSTFKELRGWVMSNEDVLGIIHYDVVSSTKDTLRDKVMAAKAKIGGGKTKPKRQAAKAKEEPKETEKVEKPKRKAAKAKEEPDNPSIESLVTRLESVENRVAGEAENLRDTMDGLKSDIAAIQQMSLDALRCSLAASGLPGDSDEILKIVREMYPLG